AVGRMVARPGLHLGGREPDPAVPPRPGAREQRGLAGLEADLGVRPGARPLGRSAPVTATIRPLTGDGSPPVEGAYPQAVEVTSPTRWLYLSGQIPVAPDGSLAVGFTAQCDQVWDNIETQLAAAGMTLDNLVKATTFLSDRRHALEN